MIRNRTKLEENGTLAPVETVKIGFNDAPTRFNLVVVGGEHVIDTVTDQYELISNSALLDAVDRAADIVGLPELVVAGGHLDRANGRTSMALRLTDGGIIVPGDTSISQRQLLLENNYAGRGRVGLAGQIEREVCTNGMRAFVVEAEQRKVHIGIEDLDEWALEVVSIFAGKSSVFDMLTEIASKASWSPKVKGEALVKTAPARYRERFTAAIKANTHDLGFNAWAAMQAVTEMATHDMKDTVTARKWSDAAIEKVLADIGETWSTVEAKAV